MNRKPAMTVENRYGFMIKLFWRIERACCRIKTKFLRLSGSTLLCRVYISLFFSSLSTALICKISVSRTVSSGITIIYFDVENWGLWVILCLLLWWMNLQWQYASHNNILNYNVLVLKKKKSRSNWCTLKKLIWAEQNSNMKNKGNQKSEQKTFKIFHWHSTCINMSKIINTFLNYWDFNFWEKM